MKNRDRYPVGWFDTIRPSVLQRDGYKCKFCGAGQRKEGYYDQLGQFVECDAFMKEWALKNGFKVQVIHLQVAHKDHNPSNNELSNLVTLCPRHHLLMDVNRRKELQLLKKGILPK